MQLLATLGEADLSSIDALNRRLWAWVEGEYHRSPHKGLSGETPMDRWAMVSDEVRLPDMDVSDLVLFEQKRKVAKDRTVSLRGVVYEVEAELVGETVTLRFDPSLLGKSIQVMHQGKRMADAARVDAYANCFVKRGGGSRHAPLDVSSNPDAPTPGLSLRKFDDSNAREDGRCTENTLGSPAILSARK